MSHSSHVAHHDWPRWQWWVIFVAGLVGVVFGTAGFYQYELSRGAAHVTWSGCLYHALQMFVLHTPYLEGPTNVTLEIGRWSAAFVFGLTALSALSRVFASEWRLLLLSFTRGHVVICGLGKLGLPLAMDYRRRGRRVVAIEASQFTERAALAHQAGITVVIGDASRREDLVRAGAERASQVIAVCDDEQTNVAVASAVGALRAGAAATTAFECWIFIADARLRRMLQTSGLFPHTGGSFKVNVRGLDLFEVAARQVLARTPIDFERIKASDDTVVHLIVLGFGPMGQHLALQAARVGHFANFEKQKLRITVVDGQDDARVKEFLRTYPRFGDVCDFSNQTVPVGATDTAAQLAGLISHDSGGKELVTFALCWDSRSESAIGETEMFDRLEHDDPVNLAVALDLAAITRGGRRQLLVFQTRKRGFGALFPVQGRGKAIDTRMHAFGMLETMCTLDTLVHERDDVFAQALHQNYYDKLIESGKAPGSKPALYPWEQLADRFKESNRRAADHIAVKLRAAGYRVDSLRADRAPMTTLDDHVELLARMEHERWNADYCLAGYSLGPRDDAGKTHDCLRPWNELDKDTQNYDRNQVRTIPEALERAGFGIYDQVV